MRLYCNCKKCDYNVNGTCYAESLEISLEGECMDICIIEDDGEDGDGE